MTLFFITSDGLWSAKIDDEYITFNLVALRKGSTKQQGFGMAGIFLNLLDKQVLQFPGICRAEASKPFAYEGIFIDESSARAAFESGKNFPDHSDQIRAMFSSSHPLVKLFEPV